MGKRAKRSPIWKISRDEFVKLVNESSSTTEILAFFGLENKGGNNRTLWNRISAEGIDVTTLKEKTYQNRTEALKKSNQKLPNERVFCKNSTYNRTHLKNRIIKENLIPYVCAACGLGAEWQGKPLTLHLEHKNGKNDDNELRNLCFLCPNCHSQTETYSGRNIKLLKKRAYPDNISAASSLYASGEIY